jgi:hypothetical protein
MAHNLVPEPYFAMFFSKKTAELTLGAIDTARFFGSINWVPINRMSYRWELYVAKAVVGNSTIPTPSTVATFDNTVTYIGVPLTVASRIYEEIGTFTVPEYKGLRVFQCNKMLPSISLWLGLRGKQYTFTGEDYVVPLKDNLCTSVFQPLPDIPGRDLWVLGTAFMKKYYTIFDYSKGGRIGLAKAAKPFEWPSEY